MKCEKTTSNKTLY